MMLDYFYGQSGESFSYEEIRYHTARLCHRRIKIKHPQ